MEEPNKSISKSINEKYTTSYEDLLGCTLSRYCHIPNIQPQTTFVNETGVNMFVIRSRMPTAEKFAEWVCGEVLPSIRKHNKYEIDPKSNPYKELNDVLKIQNDELKFEVNEYKQSIKQKDSEISKLTANLFTMKPSCIVENKNKLKDEYCILYKKSTEPHEIIENPEILYYPYYACRVQEDSILGRLTELKIQYPQIVQLRKYKTPNSVNFFNHVLTELPILERGNHKFAQSFRIRDSTVNETKCLEILDNIYRINYGNVNT